MSKTLTNIFFVDENINSSQILSATKEVDFFRGIYENQIVLWSMGITYFFGLFGCIALRFVIWFERSGQAGHFRTLVNQLVSFNLEQVRSLFFYKCLRFWSHIPEGPYLRIFFNNFKIGLENPPKFSQLISSSDNKKNLVECKKCKTGFRQLCNKILYCKNIKKRSEYISNPCDFFRRWSSGQYLWP